VGDGAYQRPGADQTNPETALTALERAAAEFLRSVPIDDSNLDVIFTIHNRDKTTSLFMTIGFRDPVHFGSSKAEQHIRAFMKACPDSLEIYPYAVGPNSPVQKDAT